MNKVKIEKFKNSKGEYLYILSHSSADEGICLTQLELKNLWFKLTNILYEQVRG